MSLLFNTLSRFVIAFLPRSKHPLILWLQSPSALILEPKKIKSVPVSTFSTSISHEVMGLEVMILGFVMLKFKPAFFPTLLAPQETFSSSSISAIRVVSSAYLRLLIFLPAILILPWDSSSPAFYMMYSAYKLNKRVTTYSLFLYSFPSFEPVHCSMSGLTLAS